MRPFDIRAGVARFVAARSGATAVWFAVAVVVLLMLVMGGIDLSRIQSARTRLQDSLDAATLAVARSGLTTDDEIDKAGDGVIAAEFQSGSARLTASEFKNGAENAIISTAQARLEPMVAGLVFKNGILVEVASTVKRGQESPVELVLVLDTTASMAGAKLTTLKTAAKNLVTKMTPSGVTNVKIGVVPFGAYVNVGVSRRNQPWVDVPADYVETIAGKCTTQTTTTTCQTETYACVKYNDGVPYNTTCSRSINCVTKPLDPPKTTCTKDSTKSHVFKGCVGSPAYPRNVRDDDPTRRYPGFLDKTCANEFTPLTTSPATVTAAINALSATGDTYIPSGLAWGFNLLSSAAPMTEAAPYDSTGQNVKPRKALVLMTDGMNSKLMRAANGDHEGVPSPAGAVAVQANTYTAELCVNIKAQKIEVFTVAFQVTDPTIKGILQTCASDSQHYFDATNAAELEKSFENIAEALRHLYISK